MSPLRSADPVEAFDKSIALITLNTQVAPAVVHPLVRLPIAERLAYN